MPTDLEFDVAALRAATRRTVELADELHLLADRIGCVPLPPAAFGTLGTSVGRAFEAAQDQLEATVRQRAADLVELADAAGSAADAVLVADASVQRTLDAIPGS